MYFEIKINFYNKKLWNTGSPFVNDSWLCINSSFRTWALDYMYMSPDLLYTQSGTSCCLIDNRMWQKIGTVWTSFFLYLSHSDISLVDILNLFAFLKSHDKFLKPGNCFYCERSTSSWLQRFQRQCVCADAVVETGKYENQFRFPITLCQKK